MAFGISLIPPDQKEALPSKPWGISLTPGEKPGEEKTSFWDEGLPPFSMMDYPPVPKTKTRKAAERGWENAKNFMSFSDAMYEGTEDIDIARNRIKLAQTKQREEPIVGGLLKEPLYRGAEVVGGMVAAGAEGTTEGLIGMGAGAIAGALYAAPASVGPQGLLTEPSGIAAGAVAGGITGLKLGTAKAWWKMSSGEMIYNMLEDNVPADTAKKIAGFAAIPYTLVELYQVKALTPNLKTLVHKQLTKSVPRIIYRALKKYGAVWTEEVAEEVVQEMISISAEGIAKELSGQKVEMSQGNVREALIRLWETTKQAGTAMAYLPIPGAATQAVGDVITPGMSPKEAKMVLGAQASQGNIQEMIDTLKTEKIPVKEEPPVVSGVEPTPQGKKGTSEDFIPDILLQINKKFEVFPTDLIIPPNQEAGKPVVNYAPSNKILHIARFAKSPQDFLRQYKDLVLDIFSIDKVQRLIDKTGSVRDTVDLQKDFYDIVIANIERNFGSVDNFLVEVNKTDTALQTPTTPQGKVAAGKPIIEQESDQVAQDKITEVINTNPTQVDSVPSAYQRQTIQSMAKQMGLDHDLRQQLYQELVGKPWAEMNKAEAQTVLDFLKVQIRTLQTQQKAQNLGITSDESKMLQKLAGNEERYSALLNIISSIGEMPTDKNERKFVLDNYKSLGRAMNKWATAKEAVTVYGKPDKHNLLSHWASVRYALGRAEMMTGQSLRLPYENIVMFGKLSRDVSFNKVWEVYKKIFPHPTMRGVTYQQNEALRWWLFAPDTPEGAQAWQQMNSQTQTLAGELKTLLKDYGGVAIGVLRFKLWLSQGMIPESLAGTPKPELDRIIMEGAKALESNTFNEWVKTQPWAAKESYYMSQRAAESFSLDFLNSIIGGPETRPSGVAVPKGEEIPTEVHAREDQGNLIPAEGPVIDNIIYHFARVNTAIFAMGDLLEFWNNFKKAKPTRDDVSIMKTFMAHALGHGEISVGATKFIGRHAGALNRFFWRVYFVNPGKGLWFYIRNLWQNMAYAPSQLGIKEAFKATKDIAFGKGRDQRASDYNGYWKSTITEKQQMFRQAMMIEQGTISTKLQVQGAVVGEVSRRLGMAADVVGNIAVSSDEINRSWAWAILHRAAQRNLELYREGKISFNKLINRLRIRTLDPTQRIELTGLLNKKNDVEFVRQVARYKVENIHFRYETALRSAMEQSAAARATLGLLTFQRGTIELVWHNGLKRMAEGIQNQDYKMAYQGLNNFLRVLFWSGLSRIMLYKIFGKRDYGLFSTILGWSPLSPGVSKLREWTEGMRKIESEGGTIEEKVKKVQALLAGFTEWAVPLVDVRLRMMENENNEKGITLYKQLREKTLSKYERLYHRIYTKVDRTNWQKMMHLLIGGFEDPAKEEEMMNSWFGGL